MERLVSSTLVAAAGTVGRLSVGVQWLQVNLVNRSLWAISPAACVALYCQSLRNAAVTRKTSWQQWNILAKIKHTEILRQSLKISLLGKSLEAGWVNGSRWYGRSRGNECMGAYWRIKNIESETSTASPRAVACDRFCLLTGYLYPYRRHRHSLSWPLHALHDYITSDKLLTSFFSYCQHQIKFCYTVYHDEYTHISM